MCVFVYLSMSRLHISITHSGVGLSDDDTWSFPSLQVQELDFDIMMKSYLSS